MIRQATKYDKKLVIELMKQFYYETNFDTEIDLNNIEYQEKMFDTIVAGHGVIFIAENMGLLVAVINGSAFDPKTLILNCLAWAVRKQNQNQLIGKQLLDSYIQYAEELKKQGRIKYYTINKTPKTPNIDYSKFGFCKIDEVWAK